MTLDNEIKSAMLKETEKFEIPSDIRERVFGEIGVSGKRRKSFWETNNLKGLVTSALIGIVIGGMITMMVFYSPIKESIYAQEKFPQNSSTVNKVQGSEYVKLQLLSAHSTNNIEEDITKLYPEYLPSNMKLVRRAKTEDGKGIILDFSGNPDDSPLRYIHMQIIPKEMFNIESHIGENVTLGNNKGFLESIYYPDGKTLEMGSISYEMNDTVILAKASGISKDELLNTIDSIKETKDILPDHTDDSALLETVSNKILGEDYYTSGPPNIDEAIKGIEELGLEYELVSIMSVEHAEGYDGTISGFTVREGVVFLFVTDSKTINSPK